MRHGSGTPRTLLEAVSAPDVHDRLNLVLERLAHDIGELTGRTENTELAETLITFFDRIKARERAERNK